MGPASIGGAGHRPAARPAYTASVPPPPHPDPDPVRDPDPKPEPEPQPDPQPLLTTIPSPTPSPLPAADRDPLLDALRGAALLGVLAVNLVAMGYPESMAFSADARTVPGGWALSLTWFLFMGKAYALLALLFGHGVGLQAARLEASGRAPAGLLSRRLLALGAIGLAHGLLGWYGDVLVSYALFGFILLAFLRASPRALLTWAAGLLLVGAAFFLVAGGLLSAIGVLGLPEEKIARAGAALGALADEDTREALQAYGQGPYGALFLRRLRDLAGTWGSSLVVLPELLALFLAGLWAARTGALHDPARRPALRRAAGLLLAAGLPLNALYAWMASRGTSAGMGFAVLAMAAYTLAAPALAAAAALLAMLGRETAPARALTRLLAPLGRVSLSAYLLQTAAFTPVFYANGLALYGRVPYPALLAAALAFWLLEVLLAGLWLARFRTGPAEWLLRRLEYGRAGNGG